MKQQRLFFLLFSLIYQFVIAQNKGIHTSLTLTEDLTSNFKGGLQQASGHLGNIDLIVAGNLGPGEWVVYGLYNYGAPSSAWVGDLQVTNNIEALSKLRLYQFWYRRSWNTLSLTIGQHDLNSVFAITDYGSTFINSSFGIQPDLSTNAPFPIFPVASPGIVLEWELNHALKFSTALYDGDPGSESDNPHSIDFYLGARDGLLHISELQYQTNAKQLKGVYKLGYWKSSASPSRPSVYGLYGILDQQLYQHPRQPNRTLGAFMQWGTASPSAPVLANYYSIGLVFTGLLAPQKPDVLGIAYAQAQTSPFYQREVPGSTTEGVLEIHYTYPFNDRLAIKPNLQWVYTPGAMEAITNALIGVVRMVYTIF